MRLRDIREHRVTIGLSLAIAVLLGYIVISSWQARQGADRAEQNASTLAVQVRAACLQDATARQLGDLCRQAKEVQKEPAEPLPESEGPPSPAQIARAVAAYCAEHDDCRGRTGVAGVPGRNGDSGPAPTPAQVAAAVAQYCNARGECRGPEGARGEDGATGDPGRTGDPGPRGPQGDPPSDAQISAAVASYCEAHDQCRGPRGEQGPAGPAGPAGRGIQSGPDFVRDDNGQCVARTTYDDGSTYDSPAGESACPPAPLLR